ncbi:hypothetical protein [Nocardia sp. XZ_19_385]|uniref:hypothetical protein n=1 Tax=Nocardia sp. XZ_19_385 TaxID=2769488 RepID=UPI00188EDAFF|nr:hypothetical protein [Nocardia sp. XZ_19_385]
MLKTQNKWGKQPSRYGHPSVTARGATFTRRRIAVLSTLPAAVVLVCSGIASAATPLGEVADQPGVTSPTQPGTTPAPPPPPPVEPAPVPEPAYEQPPEVRNAAPSRPTPSPAPAPPVELSELHWPEPVPPVAPIEPPPNKIRIGQFETETPPWLPPEVRDTINDVAAGAEAQVATALDSVGIPPGRSDRVSGATTAGLLVGGAAGATVAGAPVAAAGALVGGAIGGTIGGIAGAAIGTVIPVPVIGTVTSGVAGTALGAAAGAAAGALIAGAPLAAIGAVVGGTVGAGFGAGVGVGQP